MQPFDKVSFYVVAHADDWQLFMHPNVHADLVAPNCKVVFIIATAGDSGMGESFWKAREEGLKSSIRFCLAPRSILLTSGGNRKFNGHTVNYWSVNNSTTYFLRLPDGNLNGSGFQECRFQSLSRFKAGQINIISTVDDSATYQCWPDFTTTIEAIIKFESEDISNSWIHYLNPETAVNPNDHPDHIATGQAIQQLTILPALHQLLFTGYSVGTAGGQLSSNELFWKAGMLAVYEKAVYDGCGYSTLKENHELYAKWCCCKPEFLSILPG